MDRIQGELSELRARCARYLDDTDTTVAADISSGMMGRTGAVSGDREFVLLMHERVTRLEDTLAKLFDAIHETAKSLGLRP
jgi:hypothetical protein